MKTFVKENWYKLMIGCSMFIFSISALIYSVAPARAEALNPLKKISNNWISEVNLDFYLLDNQQRIWWHPAGTSASSWQLAGKTLK